MGHEVVLEDLIENAIIKEGYFSEPVQIILVRSMGNQIKINGVGLKSGKAINHIINKSELAKMELLSGQESYDGSAARFRLGIEAMRLGLAYEYDPYFSLSIARVDPLPHQLEAVYDNFLKLPRIRFLLADDPGAGKTIMAGLLIKELKIRGLIKRTLLVTPANLTFQWQREMKEKFRENFEIIKGDVLRANYGSNPWQEKNQVITSVSWISRMQDANESLLRSNWDLIIVDEAHKMSASSEDNKTLMFQLGENLSKMTDHFLLMTATPHKGNPENFRLFLQLLDKDIYADIKSLEEAIKQHNAPFYLRRVKEALVTFPDPTTGEVKTLFTKRKVQTIDFQIDNGEMEFYDALTRYVENQSIKAAADDSARGRALGFTMALLQRRFASSVYAVRHSLERMKSKRENILRDPDAYRQKQILDRRPEDFDNLPEEEQQAIIADLEEAVASINPSDLREEITQLSILIDEAKTLETREVESKLKKLKQVITDEGIFKDPKMKLLIFTEHKDTLDYLVEKLRSWGLTVTQIHGGMKVGDRNTPNTRIYSEREFRESCQVLVATEAAGEGINLQFCWFMINYDIPWNPMRLEQRMGRIHRYGQERDCLIFNFVATNTREGRVLNTLFDRISQIEEDLDPKRTGKVFNVLGEIFPSNQLERMLRDMYSTNTTENAIRDRIVKEVDTERFKHITDSTLEGLAKKELNLSSIIGKTAEAKERRLVPEVIEDFFSQASTISGIPLKETSQGSHIYRSGKVPRLLWTIGDRLEPSFGKLGKEYKTITFDKEYLKADPTLEWVTPGHPLFECVRDNIIDCVQEDLRKGSIFYDLNADKPSLLDVFIASIKDGRGNTLHRRLFVVETKENDTMVIHQPTIFLDLMPGTKTGDLPTNSSQSDLAIIEKTLITEALSPFLEEVKARRMKEIEIMSKHLEISLNELINRQQLKMAELVERQIAGDNSPLMAANLQSIENRLDELNARLENRRKEFELERNCAIADIKHIGRSWVLPHPERNSPGIAPMVRDDDIERRAIEAAIAYEESRGWIVVSVEKDNRGFDLISRKPHPEDTKTAIEVRFIEVKGRAYSGEVALSKHEYDTAVRLKNDYWLYTVYNCANIPEVYDIQNPARLGWEPVISIEHYKVGTDKILGAKND